MDAQIAALFDKLLDTFRKFIQVRNYPNMYGDSDTKTVASRVALQQMRYIDCTQRLGGESAKFLRVMTSGASTFFFTKSREPAKEITYREPFIAGTYYNFQDEDVVKFRFEPAAYPCTITFYMSR